MLKYLPDVVTLELDVEKCTGCGMCAVVCPHGVFAVENGKARTLDRDLCIECGACARNCPEGAIFVLAGVGCATGHILAALGSTSACCCATERDRPGPARSCCTTERDRPAGGRDCCGGN